MPPVSPTSHSVKNNEWSLYQIEWISPMPPFNCRFSLQESHLCLFSPHSTDCLPFSGTGCLASGKPSCLLGDYPSYRRAASRLLPLRMVSGRKALNHCAFQSHPASPRAEATHFRLLAPWLLTSACRNLLWFIMLSTLSTAWCFQPACFLACAGRTKGCS